MNATFIHIWQQFVYRKVDALEIEEYLETYLFLDII